MAFSLEFPSRITTKREEQYKAKKRKRKTMERHKLTQISNNDFLSKMDTVGLQDTTVAFNLNEDGCFELTANELFSALVVLNSPEFEELIDAHNSKEECEENMHNAFDSAYDKLGTDDMTCEDLYNLMKVSRRYGRHAQRVRMLRSTIEYATSWQTWINACRLYEALTGIPREWL